MTNGNKDIERHRKHEGNGHHHGLVGMLDTRSLRMGDLIHLLLEGFELGEETIALCTEHTSAGRIQIRRG